MPSEQIHNREAEEAVIGSVFIDPELIKPLSGIIQKPGDFYVERLGHIWDAMVSLDDNNEPIDILTVCDELQKRQQLDNIGGRAYLITLLNQVPTSLNAESYARTVREDSVRRSLLRTANYIAEQAYNTVKPLDDVLHHSEVAIRAVASIGSKSDAVPVRYYTNDDSEDNTEFIATPWPRLNNMLRGGYASGELNLVAGRPGDGKTAFMVDVATHMGVRLGKNVLIFSLEMRARALINRMLSYMSGIDSEMIDRKQIPPDMKEMFDMTRAKLGNANIYIDDDPDLNASSFVSRARAMHRDGKADIIMLDYLQLMMPENRSDNREQQVALVSRTLKRTARELDIPVLSLAQLSRAAEQRVAGEPQLSDLRESGTLEQDADTVMFLWKMNDTGRIGTYNARVVQSKLAKNRNGKIGLSPYLHRADAHLFVEASKLEVGSTTNF